MAVGGAIVAFLLTMGSTSLDYVSNGTHFIEKKLGLKDPGSLEGGMAHCDPTWWRDVLPGAEKDRARVGLTH